ncbi:FtsX-like permease family protein [Undibacterium sp.]|uniref:ABC transporter permease n=1 Tax=Undibacterium sp. TaxID=1914977 RepID=UPI0025FFDFFA|nr:FtsX-like permease family protein [Undibacterium sp.]
MKTLSLALRNLLRNRRRSLTTLLAMIIGLVTILVFGGYSRNVIFAMQTGYVQLHGHLQIQHQDYFLYGSGNPAAYGIADYQRMIEQIKQDPVLAPMLLMATPKLQLGGIAGNFSAGVSKNVIASGILVDDQNKMRLWDDYGSASYTPQIALAGTAQDAVVIGTGVARMLQLCGPLKVANCSQAQPASTLAAKSSPAPAVLADDIAALSALEAQPELSKSASSIEMLAANLHGAPNVASLNVIKAENWGLKEFDDSYMVMHLAQAQRLIFGADAPQVTAIQIQLQHTAQMPIARERLKEILKNFNEPMELLGFEELAPIYGQTIQFFDSVFGFIATLIGVIVLFTVGNTMSMAVVERTTEIGTLRAIGQRRGGIRSLFVCEGMLLGLIGASLGVLIALLIAFLINHAGLSWTPPGYVYAYPLKVRIWGDLGLIFGCAIGLFLVAVISAWWPAKRAAKMMIVDALRHV